MLKNISENLHILYNQDMKNNINHIEKHISDNYTIFFDSINLIKNKQDISHNNKILMNLNSKLEDNLIGLKFLEPTRIKVVSKSIDILYFLDDFNKQIKRNITVKKMVNNYRFHLSIKENINPLNFKKNQIESFNIVSKVFNTEDSCKFSSREIYSHSLFNILLSHNIKYNSFRTEKILLEDTPIRNPELLNFIFDNININQKEFEDLLVLNYDISTDKILALNVLKEGLLNINNHIYKKKHQIKLK